MVIVWKSVISSDVENNGADVIELSYVLLQLYLLRCQSRGVLIIIIIGYFFRLKV